MLRYSPKFTPSKTAPVLKWFFYGFIFGAIAVFILMQFFRKSPEPIQLVIQTPPSQEEENPDEYFWLESGNVGILEPKPNAVVKSPLLVRGMAQLPENKVYLRLVSIVKDKDGQKHDQLLAEKNTAINPIDAGFHGQFEISLEFSTSAKAGVLEIFGRDKEGKEIEKLVLDLIFESQ